MTVSGAIDSVDQMDAQADVSNVHRPSVPGPLFKEIYAGLIDVEDPTAWRPVLESEKRSFLAHTTDIQTLEQFRTIHQTPEKSGTRYHHKTYVATLESLNV